MFSVNDRVEHLTFSMVGTVIAERTNLELHRQEIRVLFDEEDKVRAWAPSSEFKKV